VEFVERATQPAVVERLDVGGIDVLVVDGEAAAPMVAGARSVTDWGGTAVPVADREAALAWLRENIAAGDVVLVKASRGAALEHVAQGLVERERE
jgi:UDP-N-acetylmuramoyl-tripeptide--D-alanyl-D-alanine ligase